MNKDGKATFTPGPWGVWNATDVFTDYAGELDGFQVADCFVRSSDGDAYPEVPYETKRANARLIAAAPALLEAIEQAYSVMMSTADIIEPTNPMQAKILRKYADYNRAAIAKAQGEAK